MLSRVKAAVSTVVENLGGPQREQNSKDKLQRKYQYARPEVLDLLNQELSVALDHQQRPILVPRDLNKVPLTAGYAECCNAGKSSQNEDQAVCRDCLVTSQLSVPRNQWVGGVFRKASSQKSNSSVTDSTNSTPRMGPEPLPFTYFAVFDGHAGPDAALYAANNLHVHVQSKLCQVLDLISLRSEPGTPGAAAGLGPTPPESPTSDLIHGPILNRLVTPDLVIGALEHAFAEMDEQIERERRLFKIQGGCAALACVVFLNNVYIANAGDSRAIVIKDGKVTPLSYDFTPETERQRIQSLAFHRPELLGAEFVRLAYPRRLMRHDLKKKTLYKDYNMTGWSVKTVDQEDLKFPLVFGEGKGCRLLGTIGLTRGFGDHDLSVFDSAIRIKPFLLCAPEVNWIDLTMQKFGPNDVIIMASDGLWDILSNEKAAEIVLDALEKQPSESSNRYTVAAQDLVMHARGSNSGSGWRTASGTLGSGDDISVFVIPLRNMANDVRSVDTLSTDQLAELASGIDGMILDVVPSGEDAKADTLSQKSNISQKSSVSQKSSLSQKSGVGQSSSNQAGATSGFAESNLAEVRNDSGFKADDNVPSSTDTDI